MIENIFVDIAFDILLLQKYWKDIDDSSEIDGKQMIKMVEKCETVNSKLYKKSHL